MERCCSRWAGGPALLAGWAGGTDLPHEGDQVLGPGGVVLHADRAEELHQGLHRVAGVDVIGPLQRERERATEKGRERERNAFYFLRV